LKIDEKKIFQYESDWFQDFEAFINKEKKTSEDRISIKANIIESNQSINDIVKRFSDKISIVPGKESFFHNIIYRDVNENYYLYLNTQSRDSRFWIIHNIQKQEDIQNKIDEIFNQSYLQDKIYLSNQTMESYRSKYADYSLGMSLKFDSKINNENISLENTKNLLANSGISLRCWTQNKDTISKIINGFNQINLPVNFNYINCVFEDEDKQITVKENLYFDGRITIEKGRLLGDHVKFIKKIRNDYQEQLGKIEEYRPNWEKFSGDLFEIHYQNHINPISLINQINENYNIYKIYAFYMYKSLDSYEYHCIDGHTGGKFYLTVCDDMILVNLNKTSCGNIILRLLSNLQKTYEPNIELTVNNENFSAITV
jgi:hypothetical protein